MTLLLMLPIMAVNVLDQVELGVGRTDDQDFLRAFQRLGYGVVEVLVFRAAAGAYGAALVIAAFVVQLVMTLGGTQDGRFDIIRADVHDVGFGVIDPYNGVIVRHGVSFVGC